LSPLEATRRRLFLSNRQGGRGALRYLLRRRADTRRRTPPRTPSPQYLPAGYRSPSSASTSLLSSDNEFDSVSPRALVHLQEHLSVVWPIDGARGQSPVQFNDVGAQLATVGRRAATDAREATRRRQQPRRGALRYIDSGEPLPRPLTPPPQYLRVQSERQDRP